MKQVEIIKAILAGEALEWHWSDDEEWSAFNSLTSNIEHVLNVYISLYDKYAHAEFRLKPKTVRYQTRAYLWEGRVGIWCSDGPQSQTTTAFALNDFHWLEETQEKEYTL